MRPVTLSERVTDLVSMHLGMPQDVLEPTDVIVEDLGGDLKSLAADLDDEFDGPLNLDFSHEKCVCTDRLIQMVEEALESRQ